MPVMTTTDASRINHRDRRRAARDAMGVGALAAAVVAAAVFGAWSASTNRVRENYRDHLMTLARFAAQQVDPSLHGLLHDAGQMDGPIYRRAVAPLQRLLRSIPEIRYVYTVVRDGDDVRYVLDAAEAGDANGDGVEDRSSIGDLTETCGSAERNALGWDGSVPRPSATPQPCSDAWGTFMSGFAPFYDSVGRLGGAVGVDVDASGYVAQLQAARHKALLGLLPAGLMILGLMAGIYRLRLRDFAFTRAVRTAAQEAEAAARRDRLTRLANRLGFTEGLARSLERIAAGRQHAVAVYFFDFDHFKVVNDTLGHDAGDELLRQIAGRLRAVLGCPEDDRTRTEDERGRLAARFGGDEFVVLADDVTTQHEACELAATMLAALATPYTIKGQQVVSTASIGVAVSGPRSPDVETLIHHADVAMYAAKHGGRGCHVLFDEAMHARLTRKLTIERSLLRAIGTTQLRLVYQPIVELETGRLVAAEALLRWTHPELGEITADELVAIAEESGLIVPLGEWVLQRACAQLAAWRLREGNRAPDHVCVNVSRTELASGPRLVERVRAALDAAGLPGEALRLEVAERHVLRAAGPGGTAFEALAKLGVRVSMDGFDHGASSLARLRGYPFDTVKLHRTFVQGITTSRDVMAVMHATLTLLENLGLASVAVGVEDPAQLAILQSLGCRYAQGRLLGEPMPAEALPQWQSPRERPASETGETGRYWSAA